MTDYSQDFNQLAENSKLLRENSPEVMGAFSKLHGEAITDAALDKKSKEFIALGIAIAIRCEGCIFSHVRTCISLGATIEELTEVVNVAILMGGGPSTVYGAKALSVAESLL